MGRRDRDRADELAAAPALLREEWEAFANPHISSTAELSTDLDEGLVEMEPDFEAVASIEARTTSGQLQHDFDEERRRERAERRAKVVREREAARAPELLVQRTWRDLSQRHSAPYRDQLRMPFEMEGHEEERARWTLTARRWAQLREDFEREEE